MKSFYSYNNKTGAWEGALGTLKKGIVISYTKQVRDVQHYWRISMASMLPFTDEQYDKAFENPEECAEYAEVIVKAWVQSLFVKEKEIHTSNSKRLRK